MPQASNLTIENSGREIVISRIIDAPPERVFDAWSRSELLERWWGPDGFTTTTHAFDFRPGGGWKHTMHGPEGTDYPNHLVYDEIERPERIIYTHRGGIDGVLAQFRQINTFVARSGKTVLTMRQLYRTAAERDAVVQKYGAIEGGRQTLARLDELVSGQSEPKPEFKTSRVFDAPRRLVFEAWSKAEYLSRWFTPAPLTTPSCELDFRPGGVFRIVMQMPDGTQHPMEARFTEIVPEERIAFVATIERDLEVNTTVTFTEHAGKTTLDVYQVYSRQSESVRGAPQGWAATLDQLAEYVRSRM